MLRGSRVSKDKFDYFIERTDLKLKEIDGKVNSLFTFRSMIFGGAAVLSFLVSVAVSLAMIYFGVH